MSFKRISKAFRSFKIQYKSTQSLKENFPKPLFDSHKNKAKIQITNNKRMQEKEQTMQHPLEEIIEKPAKVITTEGRVFVGVLRGLDQALNCILSDAQERVYSESGTKVHELGTYFIRGDMIVMIGELEETEEEKGKLQSVKCKALKAP